MIDAETLTMLRDSMARFRQDNYTFEMRGRWLAKEPGYSREAWQEYAALGWLAVPLPAKLGGFDGDPRAVAAVMEYVGGALALEPVFASTVLCGGLLARCGDQRVDGWLAAIASGEQMFALAHAESADEGIAGNVHTVYRNGRVTGTKTAVLHGDVADRLVVSVRDSDNGALSLCCVDPAANGIAATRYRLVDGRGAASFTFDNAIAEKIGPDGDAASLLEEALDGARLAMCSETYGAIRALNEATNEYLKTRKQFGRPIGANQVLQHRMVDLLILQEEVRAVIDAAQRAANGPASMRIRAVSAAAAHAATAARQTAHEAVQMHGGMGITLELPISHYFKRLMVTARLLGDRDDHVARFVAAANRDRAGTRDGRMRDD